MKLNKEETNINTEKLTRHDITGYGDCVISPYQGSRYEHYRGSHAGEHFLDKLKNEKIKIFKWIEENENDMIPMTPR